MKVLIVEDDSEIRSLLEYFFNKEEYITLSTGDGVKALKIIKEEQPDVLILDIMLPSLDGISICNMIRKSPDKYGTPTIIMLTAKTEIDDVLGGFKSGADEYIRKPFDPRELIIRVKKLTDGKDTSSKEKELYIYKELEINMKKHRVLQSEIEIELSKKEYDLLLYLVQNEGIVITRERILDKIWDSKYYVGDRTVDVYIAKIREKVKTVAKDIKTVKGVGYKLKERKE